MVPGNSSEALQEQQARAGVYALMAQCFLRPGAALVGWLAAQDPPQDPAGHEDDLSRAWSQLVARMRRPDAPQALVAAHTALFVAAGTPALNPYASAYLDGAPMNASLARLRHDLAALGLQRVDGAPEPEDHLGALCEAMQQLIAGHAADSVQAGFLMQHLLPWASRCLADMASHPGAGPFVQVAAFAQAFLSSEQAAFTEGALA